MDILNSIFPWIRRWILLYHQDMFDFQHIYQHHGKAPTFSVCLCRVSNQRTVNRKVGFRRFGPTCQHHPRDQVAASGPHPSYCQNGRLLVGRYG